MAEFVMILHGCPNIPDEHVRAVVPTFEPGLFLASYDHMAPGATGIRCTGSLRLAQRFASHQEAVGLMMRVGSPEFRPDGEPNRPLTAFTVEVVNVQILERNEASWN